MANERWTRKAEALAAAWRRRYGVVPPRHTVVLALCPASAETRCGDSWPGPDGELGTQDDENNWGATTARSLNATELAAIKAAGVAPTVGPGHAEAAKRAQAALEAAGLGFSPMVSKRGVEIPRAVIHCDSRTEKRADGRAVQVPYFVWFAAFDSETSGAEYYLTFLAEPGFASRAVLDDPKGAPEHLAAAMYSRGYFWGFKPHGVYTHPGADKVLGTADDEQRDGNAENVAAYAGWLRPHFATIGAALAGWTPTGADPAAPEPAREAPYDLRQAAGVQRALNRLGCGRPPLKVDGDFATKSVAALGFYEGASGGWTDDPGLALIPVTGKFPLVPATEAAMRRDLAAVGAEVLP